MRTLAKLFLAIAALALPARAQELQVASWSFEVAPSVGLLVPTAKLGPTVAGGLELGFALPVAERRLLVAVDAGLARPTHSGSGSDPRAGGAYAFDVGVTEFTVGLGLRWRFFTAEHKLVPYLGAGAALHMLKTTETSDLAPGENTEQGTKVGFAALAGADLRAGPGLLLAELRFAYAKLAHKWTGDTNDGSIAVALGYRFVF